VEMLANSRCEGETKGAGTRAHAASVNRKARLGKRERQAGDEVKAGVP
jgi:hypothetical protein